MIRDARDLNDYAFALGALSHYACDNAGHPEAVNKSVALMFPKLRKKYGATITYDDSPASHVIVEFSFDIVQAAAGAYVSDAYHQFIGFQVATPLVERAFRETYAIEMKDVLLDEDLAVSTYRRAVSDLIPELTRAAWRDKHEEIARLKPGIDERAFVYRYTRQQYEQEFGRAYRRPGAVTRFAAFVFKVLPKVGPLKPLSFKTPTPEAERLFIQSFKDAQVRYRTALEAVARGQLRLRNTDFDTGQPSAQGEYSLADETYAELLDRLAGHQFAGVPDPLRKNIIAFYAPEPDLTASPKVHKHEEELRRHLAALEAATSPE
jgi:hypothetical protein